MTTDDPGKGTLPAAYEKPLSPEERARQESSRAVDAAILRMASATGAEIRERPAWPGAVASIVRDPEPMAGIGFALMLADAALHKVSGYIRQAREDGLTWRQIGQALRLEHAAGERGVPLHDAAFGYATNAEHARPWERLSFTWRCPSCGGLVLDYGPEAGHPEDRETGHAGGCERQAAAIAAWDAQWPDGN
jgi:hypothetical protein